jgi:methylmalonyl-CoA mutase N-terminal domain/subunit
MDEKLKKKHERWSTETLEPALRKKPERREEFVTSSGSPVPRLCTALDSPDDTDESLGFPGEYPFTRGVQPTMYRGRLWTMRQYAGFGDADESNERYRYLLSQGQTGLSVAFDLPTQIGYDSDNPIAAGEVGKVGVAIDTLDDMERLFRDIPLDRVSTSMTINAPASILLAMYIAVAEKQGVSAERLSGTVQNDILKEYVARGTYIFPPTPSLRLITDLMSYCSENVPKFNTISISGYHIREAGSTASQEVAFTLADGIAYVRAAMDAGLDVDSFGPRISFFFNAHNDLIEEVSKFRAARRLWASIMRDRFGAKNPRSWMCRFHTQTAGSSLTAQQPHVNVVRTALQALAAVLGGTQSLHTNSFDEALGLPTEDAATLALRTQQVIAYESGAAQSIDPLGGSYLLEYTTDRVEREATELIERIDEMGGMTAAVEAGFPQTQIQESAYRYTKSIEQDERVIVGVNSYVSDEEAGTKILKVDPRVSERQVERLGEVKKNRDESAVRVSLESLKRAAEGDSNLMPPVLDAVRAYATIGEVCDALRSVFGEYRESVAL